MRVQGNFQVARVVDDLGPLNSVTFEALPLQPFKGQIVVQITDDDLLHKFGTGQIIPITFDLPD